jgi:hypothetical protein
LATINQFFATSPNIRVRNLSNIKWTYYIVIVVIIICCLHGIPYAVFANLSPITGICIYTNSVFAVYASLFIFVALTVIVSFVMIIFGCLAYRNIERTTALADQGAQKQVTRMICMQVILVVFSLAPYSIYTIYAWCVYGVNAQANPNSISYFISVVSGLLIWVNYAVCFIDCTKIAYIVSYDF